MLTVMGWFLRGGRAATGSDGEGQSLVGVAGGVLVKLSLFDAGQFLIPHNHEHHPITQNPRIITVPAPMLSPTNAGVLNWASFSNTMPIAVMLLGG